MLFLFLELIFMRLVEGPVLSVTFPPCGLPLLFACLDFGPCPLFLLSLSWILRNTPLPPTLPNKIQSNCTDLLFTKVLKP
jgi:hypothetical protein